MTDSRATTSILKSAITAILTFANTTMPATKVENHGKPDINVKILS
jgi:hypothetical protein